MAAAPSRPDSEPAAEAATPVVRQNPAWPERLLQLARELDGPRGAAVRDETWLLLNLALLQHLRALAPRVGVRDADRIHDIAAEKALNLIGKYDRGEWKPQDSSPGELVNFIATIARNALVDERRRVRPAEVPIEDGAADRGTVPPAAGAPLDTIARDRFVERLVGCADRLKPEHRLIWLFRVLYDMPSREIAAHPGVNLSPGNVDVILARTRDRIRRCMGVRDGDHHDLPPGTLLALWERYRPGLPAPDAPADASPRSGTTEASRDD
jgi:RNA polymerase sigma factor (sigma-70 family)